MNGPSEPNSAIVHSILGPLWERPRIVMNKLKRIGYSNSLDGQDAR